MIDRLAGRDLGGFVDRPQERQAAIAKVIAGGLVVHEADDLIAELAMLEDSVGDEPAELARPGDEDALEADAGAPATLERLAHELARRVGQHDVQDEKDAPDNLRHLEGA